MRKTIHLNKGWKFVMQNVGLPEIFPEDWRGVDLPHTWNAVDGHDGNGGYDRGSYWYAKKFTTPKQPLAGGRVYVEILATGQQATVYVNGQKVTYHEGGYSIFRADITDQCKAEGENLLARRAPGDTPGPRFAPTGGTKDGDGGSIQRQQTSSFR